MTKNIGSARPRDDVRLLLDGRGTYLDDVPVTGALHVAFLRSPHAHADIAKIATAAAAALPGVVRVVTASDLAAICHGWGSSQTFPGLVERRQTALAATRAVYQGQPVAAVAAETRAIAEDGVEAIEVDWRPLPEMAALDHALEPGAAPAHGDLASNLAYSGTIGANIDPAIWKEAAHVLEESFIFHRVTGVPLETRGVVASYLPADGSLTVYQSHTAPHQLRSLYAMHLGLDEGRIHVVTPQVGGSFGVKIHLYPDEIATCAIARLIGRPVKFIADRLESFTADIHAREQRVRARVALGADGRFLAWQVDCLLGMGAFSTHPGSSVQEGDETVRLAATPYRVDAFAGRVDVAFQNKTIVGQYRGVGHPMASAVTEYMVDRSAEALGVLPEELRRRNYVPDDAYPTTSASGLPLDALSHRKCLDEILRLMDMPALRLAQAAFRAKGVYRGIGLSAFIERTATNVPVNAHVRKATAQDGVTLHIDPSGSVRAAITVTEQGQGTHTAIAQVIADALGVPFERVTVISGDSAATPYGSGIRASRGAPVGGELALKAGRALRRNVLAAAATLLQVAPDDLTLDNGTILRRGGGRGVRLDELAEAVHFRPQLFQHGAQPNLSVAMHFGHDWPTLVPTNGIQASYLEVDARTGMVRLLHHWAVDDFGTLINPLLAAEQVRGGIAQGIGQALYEELLYSEDGQLTNATLADYLLPKASDLPDITVGHVETPWPHSELGAKGAGEAGTTGALGAVLTAVNDALRPLGAKITEMPMTPERILRALGKI
ncbi:MAG: xanthine dehydrogenase family protein molybdopterin-binding subunit [Alphaproteobacteria bacterium]|nr:xanthine dehydrogenase family protein molybdopterin-binding subunit [Alphaproteobacteria bacterium]